MRITSASLFRESSESIRKTSEQLLDQQRQVSSGKRIGRPSDDPAGTASAITDRAEMAAIEQFRKTADGAESRLRVVDAALSDIIERLSQAQTLALSARGSNSTAAQREAAARGLEGVRSAVLEDLNTAFNGVYVFSGAQAIAAPFVGTPGAPVSAYQGSLLEVSVDLDASRAVTIGLDGSDVSQGSAPSDVFAVLDDAAAAARAGDNDALGQAMVALQEAFNRVTAVQGRVGNDLAAIEPLRGQLSDRRLASLAQIAATEDANLAEVITGMTHAETAYRAALGATNRITRTSLMDYLS